MPRNASSKPFCCCHCENAYSTKFSLNRHLKNVHLFYETNDRTTISSSTRNMFRKEANSRHYEKNKDKFRRQRLNRKQCSNAHIELLKERICQIIDGVYNDYFPDMPIEPSGEDLNNPFIDSEMLWKRFRKMARKYHADLEKAKLKLQNISWNEIQERSDRYASLNESIDSQEGYSIQTDASIGYSSESE